MNNGGVGRSCSLSQLSLHSDSNPFECLRQLFQRVRGIFSENLLALAHATFTVVKSFHSGKSDGGIETDWRSLGLNCNRV